MAARRLVKLAKPTDEELLTFTAEDIREAVAAA